MGYLTLQQVISVAASLGRPLTVSTFRTYVTKGQAPQPADRDGRIPLWDDEEIRTWINNGQLTALTRERARERWQEDNPVGARDVAPVVLAQSHLVTLDPALPTHQAIAKAEGQLEKRVLELHEALQRLEASLPTGQADLALGDPETESETRGAVATLLQRWNSARHDREREQRHAVVQHQQRLTQRALDDAEADLQTCRTWVADLLHWAETEQQRRLDLLISAEVEAEQLDRALTTDQGRYYSSAVEFVLEDERRLSRAWLDDRTTADVLEELRTTGTTDAKLVLSGGDFGYSWRQDGSDVGARWETINGRIGQWRVSWNTETHELYAEDRVHDKVWLVGETPPATFSDVVKWLAPLERRQRERNSLAIFFAAFEEQRAADFPALRRGHRSGPS